MSWCCIRLEAPSLETHLETSRCRCARTREVGEGPAVIKHMHTRALALAETLRARCRRMREFGEGLAVIKLTHTRLLI